MSRSQFHLKSWTRHAWLNLLTEHIALTESIRYLSYWQSCIFCMKIVFYINNDFLLRCCNGISILANSTIARMAVIIDGKRRSSRFTTRTNAWWTDMRTHRRHLTRRVHTAVIAPLTIAISSSQRIHATQRYAHITDSRPRQQISRRASAETPNTTSLTRTFTHITQLTNPLPPNNSNAGNSLRVFTTQHLENIDEAR